MARLDHLLARNLPCSRSEAARLVREGRVRDADHRVLEDRRLTLAAPGPWKVWVDDDARDLHDEMHVLLHKPIGFVTALRDPRHRIAAELVREAPLHAELRPVGRLDLETSGLLLWTTDGGWVHRLTHPRQGVPRTYQAALARAWRRLPPDLTLEDGHRPHIAELRSLERDAAHPALAIPEEATELARIVIVGGAYHEVRRIFAALGSHVVGLCRIAFGRLELPRDLRAGDYVPTDPSLV